MKNKYKMTNRQSTQERKYKNKRIRNKLVQHNNTKYGDLDIEF